MENDWDSLGKAVYEGWKTRVATQPEILVDWEGLPNSTKDDFCAIGRDVIDAYLEGVSC